MLMDQQAKWKFFYRSALLAGLVACTSCVVLVRSVGAKPGVEEQGPAASSAGFLPPGALAELARINFEIDRNADRTLALMHVDLDFMHQIQTLGKLELYDRTLSLRRNED
jgi:hypothetical protein